MLFAVYDSHGASHLCDLTGLYAGCTAFLVGGAPSLKDHDLSILERRGVLTFAMNNAGALFRPTHMVCCDQPRCFDLALITDPTIMKFALASHASRPIRDGSKLKMAALPGFYFYANKAENRDSAYHFLRQAHDWKRNTLFVGIDIMISLGIKRIILAGSDLGSAGSSERDYAYGSTLDKEEKLWNSILYKHEAYDLRKMQSMFEEAGVELLDASDHSKITGDLGPYRKVTLEEGVDMCLSTYVERHDDPSTLPHCSRLYPKKDIDKIIQARYSVVKDEQVLTDPSKVKLEAVPPGVPLI